MTSVQRGVRKKPSQSQDALGLQLLHSELSQHVQQSNLVVAMTAKLAKLAGSARAMRAALRELRRRRSCGETLAASSQSEAAAVVQGFWEYVQKRAQADVLPRTLTIASIADSVCHRVVPPMPGDAAKVCFLVANAITHEECDALLQACEESGWAPASLEYGLGSGDLAGESIVNTKLRDSDRCILYKDDLARALWDRLQGVVQLDFFDPLKPKRVNSCFRCLRYTSSQAGFAKHCDGRSVVNGEISRVTVQIYLNDGFCGGATRLCHVDDTLDATHGLDVIPHKGMALIFDQTIVHKGSPVRAGTKYSARTEVMYV
eukprot:TRINITY_DN27807_c0_g1_i1.p1 TRINITY_DN27807_c0_g1~~TRINITY_DN27807_c0_g1_i1.p1  ORF type:complete len:317 (-),score=57.34 TRINITY_DN27807_c0_g1_i1:93-1043(-)